MSGAVERVVEVDWVPMIRWIANERRMMGVTQQELADRLGMTRAQLSNIECARNVPSFELVLRIVRGLGLTMRLDNPNPVRVRRPRYAAANIRPRRYDSRKVRSCDDE